MSLAIQVRGLTVRFGTVTAVDALALEVNEGEVFGFVGPNGAGKTTTIRALLDLLRPTEGTVSVLGSDVRRGGGKLRRRLGYLPGDLELFGFLSGAQTLELFSDLYRKPPTLRDEVLARLGFPIEALERTVTTYSTGMRQMIGIACAMQHDPDLLIMDEPTTGLDPLVRSAFLSLVRDFAERGKTVFLSSHVLAEVEDCADRVGLIHQGRLQLVDELATLQERLPRTVVLRYADGRKEKFHHTGTPAELMDRIEVDQLADIEVRPADLREVFEDVVKGDRS